jgi:hypothetical protein
MNNSDYLRFKLANDRALAIGFERVGRQLVSNGKTIVKNVFSGMERASWYGSCFFSSYQDVCQELLSEDGRLIASIQQVYHHHDILSFMIDLYIDYVLEKINKNSSETYQLQAKSLDQTVRSGTEFVANLAVGKAEGSFIKIGSSYAISMSLSSMPQVSSLISKIGSGVLTAFQLYALAQDAAIAANKLKTLDFGYYNILYSNRVEMLFFLIQPVMINIIIAVNSKSNLTKSDFYNMLSDGGIQ